MPSYVLTLIPLSRVLTMLCPFLSRFIGISSLTILCITRGHRYLSFMHHPPLLPFSRTMGYHNTRAALSYILQCHDYHGAYFARDEMSKNKALAHYYSKKPSLLYCSEPMLASLMGIDSAQFDEQSPSYTKGV
jgi:hypothetical protein